MNKSYYVPKISDIRVGYECKIKGVVKNDIGGFDISVDNPMYSKNTIILNSELVRSLLLNDPYFNVNWSIITPYLNKDQILAEGWTPLNNSNKYFPNTEMFEKDNYWLIFHDEIVPRIEVTLIDPSIEDNWRNPELFHLMLYCPSINEFRQIIKLINKEL